MSQADTIMLVESGAKKKVNYLLILLISFSIINIVASAISVNKFDQSYSATSKGFIIANLVLGILLLALSFYIYRKSREHLWWA